MKDLKKTSTVMTETDTSFPVSEGGQLLLWPDTYDQPYDSKSVNSETSITQVLSIFNEVVDER